MATLRRGRAKGCASTRGIGLLLLAGCAAKNAEDRASASPASRTSVQAEALKAKCADCECPEGLAQAGVTLFEDLPSGHSHLVPSRRKSIKLP